MEGLRMRRIRKQCDSASPFKGRDRGLRLGGLCFLLTIGLTVGMAWGGPASPIKSDAHVAVQVLADRTAVVPGEPLQLLVSMKADKEWHIYWRSPGGSTGLPTTFEWSGPGGVEFGRTMFPVPKTHFDSELKETSFILEGESLFETPVRVPANVELGRDVVFKVAVSYLSCKKECIPGNVELSLSLPIAAKGSKSEPANAEVFKRAPRHFPEPVAKAQHVKLSGRSEPATVRPGEKFTAFVSVEVAAGHHMQSNKPADKDFIPAVLFLEPTDGFEFGEIEYPPAHERTDQVLGKMSEYNGKFELKIPVTVDEKADHSPRRIRGVFQYQICNDSGTCFPPQSIELAIPVRMEGGAAPTMGAGDQGPGAGTPAKAINNLPAQEAKGSSASANGGANSTNIVVRFQDWLLQFGYWGAIVTAFIGGMILNLMPCVLPVISLKVLSFVRQAHEQRARVFWLGMTYSAGILVFFGAIALTYLLTDRQIGWGEQFQRPHVNIGLAALVTAFALSLFGVFAVFTPRVINKLGERAEGEGFLSAFTTGLLATLLGTACTAPFLSAAIGAASRFSTPAQGASIFLAVGVGMALPFVILAANPSWLRFIPKPGPWMGTFEAVMGFFLLATVVWLLNPLRDQIGDYGLLLTLIFLLAVSIAVWIKGKVEFGASIGKRFRLYGLALLILVFGWILPFRVMSTIPQLVREHNRSQELIADGELYRELGATGDVKVRKLDWTGGIPWQHYKRERALRDVRNGYTVFVDYTASWCANCKINKKTSIENVEVVAMMRKYEVIPYEADYTNMIPEIKEDLDRFERGGVPLYLVYPANEPDHPIVLPEILTPGILKDAIERAGPSRVQVAAKP